MAYFIMGIYTQVSLSRDVGFSLHLMAHVKVNAARITICNLKRLQIHYNLQCVPDTIAFS